MTESWSLPGKLSVDPQNLERLRELTRKIGERLQRETDAISHGMTAEIAAAVGELDDRAMRDALHSSVTDNVEVMIDQLAYTKEVPDLPSMPYAHRYAEELAREDVPESALRRAYHVGSHYLLARIFDQVQEIDCPPHEQPPLYRHLAGWLYQYIDAITRQVIATYQEEKRSSHERAARTIFTWVNRVLQAEDVSPIDFASATGHRLDQVHVGCRVWIEDPADPADPAEHVPVLSRVIDLVGVQLGCGQEPLVVDTGRREADVWFGRGRNSSAVDAGVIDSIARAAHGARIAFGAPGKGAEGFRRTRSQAHQAARIAHVATGTGSHVLSYAQEGIPVIARLTDDLAATRRWVWEVLGDLAEDSEKSARQRETVRVFLESAFSYSATASQLLLHRNTIRYRLHKAEEQLQRGVTDKPLDTQLALALCRVLGSVVLVPERPAVPRAD